MNGGGWAATDCNSITNSPRCVMGVCGRGVCADPAIGENTYPVEGLAVHWQLWNNQYERLVYNGMPVALTTVSTNQFTVSLEWDRVKGLSYKGR
jgi:hypothetical protein